MDAPAIIAAFREDAHDAAGTTEDEFLWKTPALVRWLNEARHQAARRSECLLDGGTAEICKITLRTGVQTYTRDPRIIKVLRVKHSAIPKPLDKLSVRDADERIPGWQDSEPGCPVVWVPWGNRQLQLWPKPDADYGDGQHLMLQVVREPLAAVTAGSSEDDIEIPPRTHEALVLWLKFRAYMQRDLLEKYRPDEARDCYAQFEAEFGPAPTLLNEAWADRKEGYDDYEGNL